MSRKSIPSSSSLFHITARTVNAESFPLSMDSLWSIFGDYLYFSHFAHKVGIYSFVLMPNHFHLLARFPEENMSAAMGYFMGETSRQISRSSGRINQIYGKRFHRSLITNERYFRHAYKYVYRNPVKAKLAAKVEDYPYSTLHGMLGRSLIPCPIQEDTILFNLDFCEGTLDWLNRTPIDRHQDDMRKALRRKTFELPKDKNSKLPSELETLEF